jgi:hypothetical protein
MARRKRSNHLTFAMDAAAASAHTGVTLWYRLPLFGIASLAPMVERRLESARMVDEKLAAMVEGFVQANIEAVRLVSAAASGRLGAEEMAAAPAAIAAAGLRPAFRAVRANARRLHRRATRLDV